MIVKSRRKLEIEKMFRDFEIAGYLSKEEAERETNKCCASIFDMDEVGPKIAQLMSEEENQNYSYVHGIFLCYDEEQSPFPISITYQEFREFCGIVREPFELPIFYKTHEGMPVYKVNKPYPVIRDEYLEEEFINVKAEREVGEFAFYMPNELTHTVMESFKIRRPYIRMYLRHLVSLKLEENKNIVR